MSVGRKWIVFQIAAFAGAALIAGAVYAGDHGRSAGGVAAGAIPASSMSLSNCKDAKTDFITNDALNLNTNSTSWLAVPAMTKSINVGRAGCLFVTVSGFGLATNADLEFVTVMLDGNLPNPTETQFSGDTKGLWAEAHAALFAFPNVAVGAHTVAMMFKSLNGNTVVLNRPAMEIRHS
jgi:hypothetical protein